jgi:hypothetical protein
MMVKYVSIFCALFHECSAAAYMLSVFCVLLSAVVRLQVLIQTEWTCIKTTLIREVPCSLWWFWFLHINWNVHFIQIETVVPKKLLWWQIYKAVVNHRWHRWNQVVVFHFTTSKICYWMFLWNECCFVEIFCFEGKGDTICSYIH